MNAFLLRRGGVQKMCRISLLLTPFSTNEDEFARNGAENVENQHHFRTLHKKNPATSARDAAGQISKRSLRYDLIVCVRCELIDHRIEDSAYEYADSCTYEEQWHIVVAKKL